MSSKKMVPKTASGNELPRSRPQLAEEQGLPARIQSLMGHKGLTQVPFAKMLGITQASVSQWLLGQASPSLESLVKMARLATSPMEREFFMRTAYESAPYIRELVEWRMNARASGDKGKVKAWPGSVPVPVITNLAELAAPPDGHTRPHIGEEIVMPRELLVHPSETVCLRAIDDAMAPIVDVGFEVFVDLHPATLIDLEDEIVAIRTPDDAITLRWLRHTDGTYVLLSQRSSAEFLPVVLSGKPTEPYQVLGRVMFWIGKASHYQKTGRRNRSPR